MCENVPVASEKQTDLPAQNAGHAERDFLTGLHCRDAFLREVAPLLSRCVRCALLLFDVDDFKAYNRSFGHLAGDTLLQKIAAALRTAFGAAAVIARTGGDDFAVFLPCTADKDRISAQVAHAFEAIAALAQHGVPVTVSAGAASFPDSADNIPALFDAAQHALDKVKAAGKKDFLWFSP